VRRRRSLGDPWLCEGSGHREAFPNFLFSTTESPLGARAMALTPEQEELCEMLEKDETAPAAAALIRQQANEIDDLWDRLSRAYALVREESPAEMIQDEMKQLQAMLEGRRNSLSGTTR
jgi:hypothetical protein